MQYGKILLEDRAKLSTLMAKKFINTDFSKLTEIIESNDNIPCWMDTYILIYKCSLPRDIIAYDILLKKLSQPHINILLDDGDKTYIVKANEVLINGYLWYLITGEKVKYSIEAQFVPKHDYRKELFKFNKFYSSGIYLSNIDENRFKIEPTNYEIENIEDATLYYNKFLDAYDAYRSLKLSNYNFKSNINQAIIFGKDKRMIATISNILSYFNLNFEIKENYISLKGYDFKIYNEKDADKFQVKLIDAYQFFRNVVNTKDKKDIVSEVYNRKISPEIRKEFENNVIKYLKTIKNQELIDWIITISKESKYTLNITFDEQDVFYIDGSVITSPAEAKEFYIDYMDKKKEKLAVAIYKNSIINRIKNIWNKFKSKFAKT